ncbi:uncharacterized protein TRUGW13939_10347 [Talaromyces rugulosus]|uniref:Protein kinase domain-containing protein n=1 Tax=Talaromyces rugulosus TaxID=121627 RepID=A0A7H8RB02_TALRU|nr:uncharacterized protein TRUGW13939_10347 [Talaromyces rugulosus]QKX63178.1 hypothetical protein TRUGW13939_10347 [Talaromyces rugulosus]
MSSIKEKHKTAWRFGDRANEHASTPPVPPIPSTEKVQGHEQLQLPSHSGIKPKTQGVLSPTSQSTSKPFRDLPTSAVTGPIVPAEQSYLQPNLQHEAPWKTFEKVYECDLAGTVVVAVRRAQPVHVHAIRAFASRDADELYYKFRHLQHENVMRAMHCFTTKDAFYAEFEHFPLSLEQVIACKYFPDEQQLAMILRQVCFFLFHLETIADNSKVIDGLLFLCGHDMKHTSLNRFNILMNLDGRVQIGIFPQFHRWKALLRNFAGGLEHCRSRLPGDNPRDDALAVGTIGMQLMEKGAQNGIISDLSNFRRWPHTSVAVQFILMASSVDSLEGLRRASNTPPLK